MSTRHADDHFRDILIAITHIQTYAADLTFETYQMSGLRDQAEPLCPGPDWPRIQHLGNVLRHEYHKIVDQIIWDAIQAKLPSLKQDVTVALARYLATNPQ